MKREIVKSNIAHVCKLSSWEAEAGASRLQGHSGGVAQGVGPEFKPQYHKNKKQRKNQEFKASLEDPFYKDSNRKKIVKGRKKSCVNLVKESWSDSVKSN
jgi:hypothetical protein